MVRDSHVLGNCLLLPVRQQSLSGDATDKSGNATAKSGDVSIGSVQLGTGLPPVPPKIVNQIQAGEFVDMAELLPDTGAHLFEEKEKGKDGKKSKRKQVTNILNVSVFIICLLRVRNTPDLLGYQAIILEASMEHQGDTWLAYYDRLFRSICLGGNRSHFVEPSFYRSG